MHSPPTQRRFTLTERKEIIGRLAGVGAAAFSSAVLVSVVERITVWATADGASSIGLSGWVAFLSANAATAVLIGLIYLGSTALARKVVGRPSVGAMVFGLLAGLAAIPVGAELAAGEWISQQSWVTLVRIAPVLFAFVAAATAAFITTWASTDRSRFGRLGAVMLILAAMVAVVADHFVFLGTYRELHLMIWAGAVTASSLGAYGLIGPLRSRVRAIAGGIALALSFAGAGVWLLTPGSVRAALTLASPMGSNLAAVSLPPIELDFAARELADLDPEAGELSEPALGPSLERSDWNVVWITVDTLRADALPPLGPKADVKWVKPGDTPFLDDWLARSTTFEHAYAQSSATSRSMPPMLRSLQPYEDTLVLGEPLGAAASRAGRTSAAVLNNWFIEPRHATTAGMTAGFEHLAIYEKRDQDFISKLFDETVARVRGDQFFIWTHFYNLHAPGYDGEMLTKRTPALQRYRRSLKWFDAKMAEIIDSLEKQGVAQNTIVVLSADHGEGLGDNRIWNHGPTVYEEEIRVPLAIHIPGVEPRVVEETVGNIDILPTLWHAMGMPRSFIHRGRSLIPAALGEKLPGEPYYMENYNGTKKAVVVGDDKLIFDDGNDTFLRFDLAADPQENDNLFQQEGERDKELMSALYRMNPGLVGKGGVANALAEKLEEIDPSRPGKELSYLAGLTTRTGERHAVAALTKIFEETDSDRVRLIALPAIARHRPDDASELITGRLRKLAGADGEEHFLHALADIGAPAPATELSLARFAQHGGIEESTARAWLRWMTKWEDPEIGPALVTLTRRGAGEWEPATLDLLAAVIGIAKLNDNEEKAQLAAFNRALLRHDESRVRTHAIQTAGSLRDEAATEEIARLLKEGDIRDRKRAMHAYAEIRGADAVDPIVEAASDPLLVLDAIRSLQKTRSEDALPYLTDIAENHYNWVIQNYAKSAIKKIRK